MNMTVFTDQSTESITAPDNTTEEKSVEFKLKDLRYVTCQMITPYPVANMTPQVGSCHLLVCVEFHFACTKLDVFLVCALLLLAPWAF